MPLQIYETDVTSDVGLCVLFKSYCFKNYDNDQMTMYCAIVNAVNEAASDQNISIIIPAGTAIQNGRTSFIGRQFHSS